MLQTFDIVVSQNAMDHFRDPIGILSTMKGLIHEDGKILITFGPPWFSPYGSHMYFFVKFRGSAYYFQKGPDEHPGTL